MTNEQTAGATQPESGGPSGKAKEAQRAKPEPVKVVDRRWWARGDSAGESAEPPPLKPTYVEELERQLADKDRLLQSYITQFKEATAEFEHVKARMRRDVAKDVERGRKVLLTELLEVVDNLDRAIAAAGRVSPPDDLSRGVEMVRSQFLVKLEGFGVARIEDLGCTFDPLCHEAVSTAPTKDAAEEGIVVGVVRPGYRMGDEILRPALVAVGKGTG